MRREYIEYLPELPLKVSKVNIEEYPIHWHDSIEILFVLKGNIKVSIESGTYEVEEGEIEIINCDESHSIKSEVYNEVLMFKIDPNFFEKYINDIRNIAFYTNSSDEGAQEEEKYYELRKYLSIIICEIIQKQDKYEDFIEDTLVELLYHLINNFHQLIYEKEDLKENEEQFERYDRIVRYIYNNYKNKISLQDIAKKEFLSSYYLSHEIKNTVGYSFKDFLNLTRVEESVKLLLDTDKSISEISEELGFSHIRYFNKHFKRHYKCTPMQYRKKHKVNDDVLESMKKYEVLDVKNALEYLSTYLEDYDRFNYENKIIKLNIDAAIDGEEFNHSFREIISVGKAKELLKERQRQFLINIQKDIEFKYAMIFELFTEEAGVLLNNKDFFNWYQVKKIIEFLLSINLRPFIIIDGNLKEDFLINLLDSFISYFRDELGDYELSKWKVFIKRNLNEEYKAKIRELIGNYFELVDYDIKEPINNMTYDTCYMIPYIIHNSITGNNVYFKAFDSISPTDEISNELFFGDNGLITQDGIKKPSYYAYYFLSRMGDYIIYNGEGCIVTKKGEDIQILLHSYGEDIDKLIEVESILKRRGIKRTAERKFSLNIVNLFYDYTLTEYEINEKVGSAYDYWVSLGKPSRINDDERDVMDNAAFPKISLRFAKKSTIYNMVPKVQGYGAILIMLKKVQKHL